MTTAEIRNTFLRFFEAREHQILPGVSLVPVGDPSVLLTSAGMQQFKQYFSGERPSPYPRIATVQKIFRATDFDEVGDLSHLTLFEMLGNFSFGDYFKEDAIRLARELILDGIGIDLDRVWVTVYEGREGVPRDDESAQIWTDLRHPAERIAYAGEDNFWGPTGDSGPCGPTTEIHINLRPDEPDVGPLKAPDRLPRNLESRVQPVSQDTRRPARAARAGRRGHWRRSRTLGGGSAGRGVDLRHGYLGPGSSLSRPRGPASPTSPTPIPAARCASWPNTRAPPSSSSATA